MRFVSGEEIHRVLTFPALVAAMEASHRRPRIAMRDLVMGEERAHYFVRSAVDSGRALGSKLFTSFPDNLAAARGEHALPAVQAVYVLFDGANGLPLAVLDGTTPSTSRSSWTLTKNAPIGHLDDDGTTGWAAR
jgi:ornithine cyclodeaminase/alanine dehydrogenase-like protein (mu-crystallin family)